ncbi:hypothetical protein ACFO5X_06325 [Seohaeicola nanhaiensis]|uniref:XRE family transcriptional regulator n=1 Tax=Seohaeicola nanhaiensis TaxID=1387282 RepID=A0ABV9KDK9_9RHOB
MRPTRAGTIQDAVARCYRAAGGVEAVAEQLGLANSTVSYGTEINEARPGGIGVNHLARLAMTDPDCALPLAEFFAALAGGVYQPVGGVAEVISLFSGCGLMAKECGEAQAATILAATTQRPKDIAEAEREIEEAIAALTKSRSVLTALQSGAA